MLWRSVVGKLWGTIILLVALVISVIGMFLLQYIEMSPIANPHQVKIMFATVGAIGFMLTTVFAFFLFTKITQPLTRLKDAANQIAQGQYHIRVHIRSSDEIGELSHSFNHMAAEVDKLIRELHDERDHLASVLRSMSDAVVTFDALGKMSLTNPPGQQLMDAWRILSGEGKGAADLQTYGDVPSPLYELYRTVLREGRDQSGRVHVLSSVWSVVMAPLKSRDSVRGAVAVLRDVTEEVKLEKLRKDFVANVSHEIRTPLSMLQGYSEALMDDIAASPEERRELVQVIHDESLRMGRLVNDLLDLARMEAGHMEMKQSRVEVDAMVRRVHRKFSVYAKERGIRLRCELPDDGAGLVLHSADEDRLEQVLTNLLDNALRHTPEGAEIVIKGGLESVRGVRYVKLTVQDEGQGIPREDLPYIFERFYKADKARTRGAASGTGLGLAIVRNIVEAHRGTIEAESSVGKGTTFTLLFPVEIPTELSKSSEW